LAQEADFLSIGSNDLIQYMLAVDRTNEQVSKLYLAHHPAILRSVKRIAVAAQAHKKDLSICGDLSSDPSLLRFLVGIGLRTFSVDMVHAPTLQRTLEQTTISETEAMAKQLLSLGRISEVEAYLERQRNADSAV
jgi:phosphoenolpyruvate-protein kinase (PTS system EI component)